MQRRADVQHLIVVLQDLVDLLEMQTLERGPLRIRKLDSVILESPMCALERDDLVHVRQQTSNGKVIRSCARPNELDFRQRMPPDHQPQADVRGRHV